MEDHELYMNVCANNNAPSSATGAVSSPNVAPRNNDYGDYDYAAPKEVADLKLSNDASLYADNDTAPATKVSDEESPDIHRDSNNTRSSGSSHHSPADHDSLYIVVENNNGDGNLHSLPPRRDASNTAKSKINDNESVHNSQW